ncbi:hypothetical protein FSP39_019747 [Pinctada imbricata]|uniref:Proteasome inhibitor PI31 subunit n=1 Tax=Pinctada imbricata TaxID=66713 RepID=A0AA89BZJ9_PINIB|nr:hypothetical protein FSP39_019747 [Pinctada imbricata]
MECPGLELLFHSVQNKLKSQQDALMTVFHWNLVSNGFKCLGTGEEAPKNATEKPTEMLPNGWNSAADLYTLRYRRSKNPPTTYIFKVICMDGDLLLHLMESGTEKVSSTSVRTSDYTNEDLSTFESAFKDIENLCKKFKKEIIDELVHEPKAGSSQGQKTSPRQSRSRPDEDDPLRVPPRHSQRPPPEWTDPDDPFAIGRGDLDPFARGRGGGMLFDPMRSGPRRGPDPSAGLPRRLPPGAVPPGARFDPFGPPGTGAGPDSDHLPPPGYDDMFM